MTEEEAMQFAKIIYRGTTYSHKMKFITFNDKYVLVQKPPSTEYVGRFGGSNFSQSEWLLASYDAEKYKLGHNPSEVCAFYKLGKLLKADKDLLKEKFGIEIPQKERNKKIATEEYVIIFDPNDYFQEYRDKCFQIHRLLINAKDSVTIYDHEKKVKSVRSKSKYRIIYYTDGGKALNDLLKLERLAREHNKLRKEATIKAKEINKLFEKVKK